jgi:transcriptional regulator with XRE-family HTH domain
MRYSLKVAMVLSGKSRDQVAADASITPWMVSRIVHGHIAPSAAQARALAAAVNVPVESVFPEVRQ